MGQLVDGKAIATRVRARVRDDIIRSGITPGLAVVLVGHDPASHLYVKLKERACAEVGIRFEQHLFFATAALTDIERRIHDLGDRSDIDGVLVQLPLPPPLDEDRIVAAIPPEKDVDGFHPRNVERLLRGDPLIVPALGKAILALIDATDVSLKGGAVSVLANSETFCRPIEALLRAQGATTNRFAPFLPGTHREEDVARSDIVISALGCGGCIGPAYVRPGAVLIDVGITKDPGGNLRGDFSPEAQVRSGWFTPVPGGVGPMTVAMLLENVLEAAQKRPEGSS
ncbi:bifunctional 5,10-methylenetetrahydrofolate dehydrogenase/5,10-methenyltetrahydrofolate cyclohydrolase [Candidatus Uhrbacteria bacterium]|nr:bifunctional 5,10-methylenetetrahydrofolate dehydrogenase/5,10-methenyltetrahydrofolate cyclohydrolase [Candidatus Uhrbacteria bacterium]